MELNPEKTCARIGKKPLLGAALALLLVPAVVASEESRTYVAAWGLGVCAPSGPCTGVGGDLAGAETALAVRIEDATGRSVPAYSVYWNADGDVIGATDFCGVIEEPIPDGARHFGIFLGNPVAATNARPALAGCEGPVATTGTVRWRLT